MIKHKDSAQAAKCFLNKENIENKNNKNMFLLKNKKYKNVLQLWFTSHNNNNNNNTKIYNAHM